MPFARALLITCVVCAAVAGVRLLPRVSYVKGANDSEYEFGVRIVAEIWLNCAQFGMTQHLFEIFLARTENSPRGWHITSSPEPHTVQVYNDFVAPPSNKPLKAASSWQELGMFFRAVATADDPLTVHWRGDSRNPSGGSWIAGPGPSEMWSAFAWLAVQAASVMDVKMASIPKTSAVASNLYDLAGNHAEDGSSLYRVLRNGYVLAWLEVLKGEDSKFARSVTDAEDSQLFRSMGEFSDVCATSQQVCLAFSAKGMPYGTVWIEQERLSKKLDSDRRRWRKVIASEEALVLTASSALKVEVASTLRKKSPQSPDAVSEETWEDFAKYAVTLFDAIAGGRLKRRASSGYVRWIALVVIPAVVDHICLSRFGQFHIAIEHAIKIVGSTSERAKTQQAGWRILGEYFDGSQIDTLRTRLEAHLDVRASFWEAEWLKIKQRSPLTTASWAIGKSANPPTHGVPQTVNVGVRAPSSRSGRRANEASNRLVASIVLAIVDWQKHLVMVAAKLDRKRIPTPRPAKASVRPASDWTALLARGEEGFMKAIKHRLRWVSERDSSGA